MLAERVGKGPDETTTIARVRSDELSGKSSVLTLGDFGIDHIIHPEQSTANEVVSLLRRAAATDIVEFCHDRVQLVGIRVERDAPVYHHLRWDHCDWFAAEEGGVSLEDAHHKEAGEGRPREVLRPRKARSGV